ncbi:ciliogenesis and planar polarity effector 1 [Apus apus]|uniref:ciliogenesis and planar polarity effector 1 n=1 Tax=Apus apus TaxID=8895 RepID=UPI0021F851E4|nr:ciliogenesis and planar polarity effector 1 [Apus apus]
MKVKLDVLISTCIKQRKPWPHISWIGQEKEAVFLLDDKDIHEINLASGKTKKKIPQLQSLLKNVVVLTTSRNGAWLAGMLKTGELFLWNKDQDCLKIVPAIEESRTVVAAAQECLMRLYLYVSGDGRKALLTTPTACVFLWESTEHENSSSYKNSLFGRWTQILPEESVMLPSAEEKEIGVHAAFIQNEILGDCCLCSFVFYSEECLVFTFLVLRWRESSFKYVSSLPYQIRWIQQTCSLVNLVPRCVSVKSRQALLCAFSGDGLLLAVAVNQTDPKATQILFLNTLNFVTVSGSLKGCSSRNSTVPSKFIRSYWVADMSWTPDSLFLACMLKRGSLILLTCMGEMLTLVTSGCSVEFGPAEFIPLHPLITYRQQHSFCQDSGQSLGSSDSESDLMRQRFSVASHSRLPYLIVSDGYMITVLRFPNNLSPSGFVRSLLLDSTQQIENIYRNLLNSKSKGTPLFLRSLLSLKASLLKHAPDQSSIFSTIPKFLEEDATEMSEKTMDLLDCEEESDDEKQFCNSPSSFCSRRTHSFVGKADQGHLEFASMFDTIHAKDNTEEKDASSVELSSIRENLLAAWQIGISKTMEEKDTLLNYTVNCIIHFFNILQFVKSSLLNQDASLNKSVNKTHWMHCVLKCFQQCLTVLHWHSRASLTGHVAKLTLQTLKLLLIQHQDELFSKSLLACFCLLKMVSHTLSSVCLLQYENCFASPHDNSVVELDSLTVPVFQVLDETTTQQFSSLKSLLREPPRVNHDAKTEKRLIVLWRLLYKKVVWYQMQLNRKVNKNAEEESVVSLLLGHIQATLQSSGVVLEQHWKINSVSGEEKFLLGSYRESVDIWRRCLCEIKAKGGKRTRFLQSRYYLAILFCHLYEYNLSEAQGLCDHLVGEILRRSQLSVCQMEKFSDTRYYQHELWMVTDVHTETAMAVIRSMARFMAAYFTNQLLYIFPPHRVNILPPLHIQQDRSPRIIPLQHSLVTRAVRDQNLSSVWTAEYALDLFFIGGLIPEAVWLTHRLGDWKLAVSIGVTYQLYCQKSGDFSRISMDFTSLITVSCYIFRLKNTECLLPLSLSPMQTFQEKLKFLLGHPVTSEPSGCIKYKQFTDPIEEEDADVLYNSIQELLKAAVMADADILSETFQLLMDSAKDISRKLYGLVPDGLYLPAPPLYCPQPASLSEEDCNDVLLKIERESRQKVSGVLQRIILLFRAAHCSCPAAQWYIAQLKYTRKVMQKIRMKGSLPSLSPFPETLLRYSNFHTVFHTSSSSGNHQFDDMTCKILGWFRELCALCWMFHVRERLSDNCRRYQTARENINNHEDLMKNEYDASTVEHCLNAVEWACRMLPFCRFMNVEELVQDIILSLLGELPPVKKVAEIFVKAFPNPEDIRVALRDKYHALQQRLRHSFVRGPESEEMMSVVIEAMEKVRTSSLRRVIRNIGPIEINIWEPTEEGAADDEEHCYDRFSLGTSLSRSTLTDLGNPQVYSDADTADTLSDALFAEETRAQTPSLQRDNEHQRQEKIGNENTTCMTKAFIWKTKHKDKVYGKDMHNQCNLPLVGAWEFERDDDEYVVFLELFLSYVLERDLIKYSDLGVPFLTSFSELLREHELNSLFFDVHTTLKRRQAKTRSQSVFRAGSCYTVTLASSDPEAKSGFNENQNSLKNPTIAQTTEPSLRNEKDLMKGLNEGLFGLKHRSIYRAQSDSQGVTVAPASQTFPIHIFFSLQTEATCKYIYKTVDPVDTVPGEELAIELMDKLNNIAKLLEWMIRWSDQRLLCHSNKQDSLEEILPMIHVKTSAAAVLTSLWLLEQFYGDGAEAKSIKYKSLDNQYLKESASVSEAESRTEKESSTDEGSSILVSPLPDVQSVQPSDLCEVGFGMSTKSKYYNKKEINNGSYSVPHMTEDLNEVRPFVQEELDVTSEREFFEEPFETPKSTSSSIKIKPLEHQRGKELSVSDIDSAQEDQKAEKTKEGNAQQNVVTEVATGTSSHSVSVEQDAKVPSNREISLSDGQSSQTVVSSVSSVFSTTSICTKKQDVKEEFPAEEKLNTSETVRQMLQDEMFKLVQLQQINFMSLMQIVQSSFGNLTNAQQILQHNQSVPLEGGQPAHATEDSGSLKTQLPPQEDKGRPDLQSSDLQPKNSVREESSNGHIKNHLDVNVSLSRLESQSKETGFMPPFQDLSSSAVTKPLHLLASSSDVQKTPKLIPIEKNMKYSNGFPLLKLESGHHFKPAFLHPIQMSSAFARPVPRVAWSSSDSLWNHQSSDIPRKSKSKEDLNMRRYDPKIPRQMPKKEARWADKVHKGPPKHLNLDQYKGQQEVSPQQQSSANMNMDKALITHNLAGIPLLHLQLDPLRRVPPVVRQPITATLIPVKPDTKETYCRETVRHTGISLLHANLSPKKKAPKLIPVRDLIAFERHQHHTVPSSSCGQDPPEPIQLLKTDVEPFELRNVDNNRKRQKRRDKQMKEEEEKKKTSVSFCPADSIISISDTMTVVESGTKDQQAKSTSYLQDAFCISVGTTGEAITTSADLHYMASMGKKPAETQDASTNTHPVLKPYQDIGTSAGNEISEVQKKESVLSVPVSESSSALEMLPPDTYLNQRFPSEVTERPLSSLLLDVHDLSEHEYVSVIDIEGSNVINNLPMIPESTEEVDTALQNENFEIPSTSRVNHMASSVTSVIPPKMLQKRDDHRKNISSQVQQEDKNSYSAVDEATWNTVPEGDRILSSSGLPAEVIDKEYFSTKQQDIDIQLQTLQNRTKEEDFRNTKLLVKLIEDFEMAANSGLGDRPSFSKDARIIDDEHDLRDMIFEDVTDDEKEGLNLEYPIPGFTTLEVHSPASSASASNLASGVKLSPDFQVSRDICDSSLEDCLQMTGLSGVTDIISDLVRQGDISPLELGFTKTQANKISRVCGSAAGRSRKTEEKKEIQAWMKRKRRERMREYVKKLDEQRQKEHNPFNPRKNVHCSPTSKDIKYFQKKKEEKDKALLSEHHSVRMSQALCLMNEMLCEAVVLPASEHRPLSRTRTPQEYRKRCVASTKGGHMNSPGPVLPERSRIAAKPSFGQKVHRFTSSLGLTQSRGNACTLLPKSTSRGRVRNAANSPVSSGHSTEYRGSRTSQQKPLRVATAAQAEGVDQESDRDIISPWTVPDDIQRILEDTQDSLFQASALHPVSFSPLGVVDTDSVSESTGSILSKLDWNAVEAMVADVEDK